MDDFRMAMFIEEDVYLRECYAPPGSKRFISFYRDELDRISFLLDCENLSLPEKRVAINSIRIAKKFIARAPKVKKNKKRKEV